MIEIACPACGFGGELPDDTKVPSAMQCPMCGTWISDFKAEVEAAQIEKVDGQVIDELGLGPIIAHLLPTGTPTPQDAIELKNSQTVFGREDADVVISDPTMCQRHFEIFKRDGEFFIRDLGSTNGTLVNGSKVQLTALQGGDRIHAGLSFFIFQPN